MYNKILKVLCSIPIVLVALYFSTFLGVLLLITRSFVYEAKNKKIGLIVLLSIGIVLLLPKLIVLVLNTFNIDNFIFKEYITSNIYNVDIFGYAKKLVIISIIFIIISYIFKLVSNKIVEGLMAGFQRSLDGDREIKEKNDLKIREKQERAKKFHVVTCPSCGAKNILTDNIGKCKYCRKPLE